MPMALVMLHMDSSRAAVEQMASLVTEAAQQDIGPAEDQLGEETA